MADFSDYFPRRIPREEGAAFLGKLKTAGFREAATTFAQNNKAALVGAAVMGAAAGLAQYHAAKPRSSGLSAEQEGANELLASHEKIEKTNPGKKGLPHDMAGIGIKTTKAIADAQAKHPVAAGLSAGAFGAATGLRLVPKLVELLKP
jgi:hypothetical protein